MGIDLQERYPDLPGTLQLPPPPRELFESLRERRSPSYHPRTRHMNADGSARYTNRLFLESSPYLLQHAHNPVNWFPWGNEAFALARELHRPVLVSIGYATCHWCHVMEEESFENEEIARFLNENFIAVKVDREERPDVDTVYMTALHAMGAQGGWPLNVFVTPERQPFYGGTYFPPFDDSRGIGFLSLLRRLIEAFRSAPQRVTQAGEQLTMAVRDMLQPERSDEVPLRVSLEKAVSAYRDRFDRVNGGLGGAPKFPSSLPVRLLLRTHRETGDQQLLHMAELTLRRMAQGGIYDQVAGGFHRYATDERWMIPHFEKMLYDNAQLPLDYLEGYQATGDAGFASVAGDILRYLQRDLASPQGAFYAATDADSLAPNGEREEGYFFTWTLHELSATLGKERSAVVAALYGVTGSGNFEGRNILYQARSEGDVAREMKLPEERVRLIAEESRELLYEERKRRPLPLRDDKVLSAWNGLALSAFARGGFILNAPAAIVQATATAQFVLENFAQGGRLAHSHQEGSAKGEGFLDDYACVIAGLIDLFEVTGEARWLQQALALNEVVQEDFYDEAAGGYYMTGPRHEALIAREKPGYDGVVPSGNSVMAMNLLRLNALTEKPAFLDRAKRTMEAFGSQLSAAPTALSHMLLALDFLLGASTQVVVVAPRGNREAADVLLDRLRTVFLPNCTLVCVCEGEELERAAALVPLLRGKEADGQRARGYLCRDKTCQLPTSDPEEFKRQLNEIREGGAR